MGTISSIVFAKFHLLLMPMYHTEMGVLGEQREGPESSATLGLYMGLRRPFFRDLIV